MTNGSKNLKEFDSEAALLEYLESHGATPIVVGIGAEAPQKFYAATWSELRTPIGLVLSFHGVEPVVKEVGTTGITMIGHDCTITGLNFSGDIEFSFPLDGVFFEFIDCDSDRVIIVHELGAVKLDSKGNCEWSVHTNIVRDFYFEPHGLLYLKADDAERKIRTGNGFGMTAFAEN